MSPPLSLSPNSATTVSPPRVGTGLTEGALAAIGHDDSPLGLAGWILETFHAWCDIRRGMPILTDRLIYNLKMHWLNGTAASMVRLYCGSQA